MLATAEKILELNNKKLSQIRPPDSLSRRGKKRLQIFGLLMTSAASSFGLLLGFAGASVAYEKLPNMNDEFFISTGLAIFVSALSCFGLSYSADLFNKIRNARSLKQQYLDSLEVKQILTRSVAA